MAAWWSMWWPATSFSTAGPRVSSMPSWPRPIRLASRDRRPCGMPQSPRCTSPKQRTPGSSRPKAKPASSTGSRCSSPRPFAGDTVRARLDGARLAQLRDQAKAHGATLFQWLLHAVAELISLESGQRDMVVSIPYAAQNLQRHAPLLADGVLDLPVRIQMKDGESQADRLRRIKSTLMDAMEFPLMTQGTAARALGLQAEGSKPPLTSIYFNLNPKVDLSGWAPLQAAMHEGRKRGLLSEVFFNFYEQADALTLDLHHSSEHLSPGRAKALVDRLMHLLAPAT